MKPATSTRTRWMIGLVFGLMLIYAVMSVWEARSAESRLVQANRDLQEVRQKLEEIQRWKQAPKIAALRLESPAEIANRVAAARQDAGIPQSALMREQPLDPQRIERTNFEMRATTIDLASCTIPQILRFCDALRDTQTGSLVRDISLQVPQSGEDGGTEEAWDAGLTLTQMIFSPKSR